MNELSNGPKNERIIAMLYAITFILIALWFLGLLTSYTLSGFIQVLFVIAFLFVLIRLIQGRNLLGKRFMPGNKVL